jgi:hypothetical protein
MPPDGAVTARTMAGAVRAALATAVTTPADAAAVALAKTYAAQIDGDPTLLPKLGPLLLSVLDALAMTPRGRAGILARAKGAPRDVEQPAGIEHTSTCRCLPCQRRRVAPGQHRAADLDSATS